MTPACLTRLAEAPSHAKTWLRGTGMCLDYAIADFSKYWQMMKVSKTNISYI